ncbi:MAG: FKBP-type peptidyl-prolyl cis-trans isomerase [Muribaculaceae bacterium]|nr:FKBP-type peptidyl-prolyl cis-trans isomerase [Roseburia sp.]MCM1430237.1 FKBP-type peptidyl-prolyl cis-trans isomerase [Muribaculaceae bacterium]MCM1493681.1 FKBP-type peptidyl-prolyl cis-trans isomerase [Muribaculaceae bacterium]
MNKENKRQAKERRAQEREKQLRRKKIADIVGLWGPIILIAAVVIVLIVAIATSGASEDSGVQDDSEFGFSLVDDDGNEMEILDWTEEDEGDYVLNTEAGQIVEEGDMINIDYVGRIDGVAFENGDTQGMGEDLTIGSGEHIDGFEEAIAGHAVGETFDMTVTFPENYGDEALNGKDAVFTTTINGIYQ